MGCSFTGRTLLDGQLQFVPSRIEGLPDVAEVTVFPDRIELASAQGVVTHHFVDVARWPSPSLLWKFLYRLGLKPRWLPVADRDWFHEPAEMFFEFYTVPRLKVCMPREESKEDYGSSFFVRMQNVLRQGGFHTVDLG
jgi:hypothetical protein